MELERPGPSPIISWALGEAGTGLYSPKLWVAAGICALLILFATSIYGFLAVNHPLGEGILVVEGWIPAKTLAESVHLFNSGGYKLLVVVGGPIQGTGGLSGRPTTYADLSA